MKANASPLANRLANLGARGRRTVSTASEDWVTITPLDSEQPLPLLVEPRGPKVDLRTWATSHRDLLEEKLLSHGGILFRGFDIGGVEGLESFAAATSENWAHYREAATPRTGVSEHVSTSTEYPPDRSIFLHNENSHCAVFPRKIYFHCVQASETGGATPLADGRRLLDALPKDLREQLRRRGVLYVRNFGDGFGFSWRKVFEAKTRQEVEAYCQRDGIEVEWKGGDRLRTRYHRPAIITHPGTGRDIWFNHATFFHVSTLEDDLRRDMLRELDLEDLPYNTFWGDGEPFSDEVMDLLREAYQTATVRFPWRDGDLLMLDNLLVAHGRDPFTGPRQVLVSMAEPIAGQTMEAGA